MPRKPNQYSSEYPSHIVSRSNNRNWFNVPIEQCWEIYAEKLNHISEVYEYRVHCFLLMSNHSHLIGTPSPKYHQGMVFNWLQTSVAREINLASGDSDHVFGKPYKPSLITNPFYFAHATRYIYQNPVRPGICSRVQDYRFSTLHSELNLVLPEISKIKIVPPDNGIDHLLTAMTSQERLNWYNEIIDATDHEFIKNALMRRNFKIARPRGSEKENWMKNSLTRPAERKKKKNR